MSDKELQEMEFEALTSIYPEDVLQMTNSQSHDTVRGTFYAHPVLPSCPITVLGHEGKHGRHSLQVCHLPPFVCEFKLPGNYPSLALPEFQLSCLWLPTKILETLRVELESIAIDNPGESVLWFWFEFLEKESLSKLLCLTVDTPLDLLALPNQLENVEAVLRLLAEHNDTRNELEFAQQSFSCDVCSRTKKGSACLQIAVCGHIFCKNCVRQHYECKIAEGQVMDITCLECSEEPSPKQIRQVLNTEVYNRYESLLLQRGIDSCDDVVSCPRKHCNFPVILDKEDSMGVCPCCCFAFCMHCRLTYHGINPCKISSRRELALKYYEAKGEIKSLMERRYGVRNLEKIVDDFKSEKYLANNSVACPHCAAYTEKVDGCNKMTCGKCGTYYCWLCQIKLSRDAPYSHYSSVSSGCANRLFEGVVINDFAAGLDFDDDDNWLFAEDL